MYRAGADADCLGHHRRRPMGDLTRRIAQRLRHRLLVQRSRQRRDARSSGLVVQQPVDPLRHETLLPAPYGDLALAGLPHDRVGPDAICRQQHDACAPHMLLSAVPIRDDRLQMRTIGAAHFNRDPLAHARSPSLAEHTLVRDSYVRFNPLGAVWAGPETLIVVSTDLSHYLDYRSCQATDRQTAAAIERLDPGGLGPQSACGRVPVRGLLAAAKRRGMSIVRLDLRNSGDTAGPRDRVVGYGSWALFESAGQQP